jgi:hypothetical protein
MKKRKRRCPRCGQLKDDVEKRFNAYEHEIYRRPEKKCWEVMCFDCEEISRPA